VPGVNDDSLDAIRNEARHALEEARSLKDQQATEQGDELAHAEPAASSSYDAVPDYSPSEPAPQRDTSDDDVDDEVEKDPVESRYSRNSAKLPRLGIEPGSASSTIADLRKQMTADN
jgi:hypothetical protein